MAVQRVAKCVEDGFFVDEPLVPLCLEVVLRLPKSEALVQGEVVAAE